MQPGTSTRESRRPGTAHAARKRAAAAAAVMLLVTAPSLGQALHAPTPAGRSTLAPEARALRIFQVDGIDAMPRSERPAAFAAAVEATRRALQQADAPQAERIAARLAAFWSPFRRPWLLLASAHFAAGDFAAARAAAQRARERREDGLPPPPQAAETAAAADYWEGRALYRMGEADAALPLLERAAAALPAWAEAWRAAGAAAFVAGNATQAEAAYAQAFRLDPRVGGARDLSWYADAATRNGDRQRGITLLQEAVRRDPYAPAVHAKLGRLFLESDQLAEAYYEFTLEALVHGPETLFAKQALNEVAALLDALRNDTSHPDRQEILLVTRALGELQEGKALQALHSLQHVERLTRSASPVPRLLLAQAHLNRGDVDAAERVLDGVLRDLPDYVPALVLLGQTYRAAGREREAREVTARAQEIFPDYWKLQATGGRP